MDNSYLERGILDLFMIDVVSLSQTKAALMKNFHIQPSEIDKMPYWEYEYILKALNQQVKEENEKQQAEMDKYRIQEKMKSINTSPKYPSTPKMPSMPSFGSMKAPSFKF